MCSSGPRYGEASARSIRHGATELLYTLNPNHIILSFSQLADRGYLALLSITACSSPLACAPAAGVGCLGLLGPRVGTIHQR